MEDAKRADGAQSSACRTLRAVERWTVRLLAVPSAAAIAALFALVCFNVAGRAFGIPVRGAVESSGVLCGAGAALALGYAQIQHAHIEGGVAAARLPGWLRSLLNGLSLLATGAFFAVAAYELWDLGMFAFESGETVDGIGEWYPWFLVAASLGFAGEACVMACCLARSVLSGGKE